MSNKPWNQMSEHEKQIRIYSLALAFLSISVVILVTNLSNYFYPPQKDLPVQFALGLVGYALIAIVSFVVLMKNNILKNE